MNEFCAQINALPRKGESLIKAAVELLNSLHPFRTRNDSLGIEANAMTIDLFVKGPKAFVTLFVIFYLSFIVLCHPINCYVYLVFVFDLLQLI